MSSLNFAFTDDGSSFATHSVEVFDSFLFSEDLFIGVNIVVFFVSMENFSSSASS